jgi:putative Mg2+ transporter-C (MgtC) family protein
MESVNMLGGLGELLLRLVVATLIGSILGLDRELRGKPAGLRTHALVALGAALMTIVSIRMALVDGHFDGNAVSRVIQGIVAGIGFLGGGAILKSRDTNSASVHGLTTATTIWVVSALGIACGAGQWVAAVIATALALVVLVFGNVAEDAARRIAARRQARDPERLRQTDAAAKPNQAP